MAVIELTKENFEKVITSNPTVIVDYWRPGAVRAAVSRPCSSVWRSRIRTWCSPR